MIIARGSVAANVLLFGEYAILERGGMGIACAVAPRIEITISAASAFAVVGITGGGRVKIEGWPALAGDDGKIATGDDRKAASNGGDQRATAGDNQRATAGNDRHPRADGNHRRGGNRLVADNSRTTENSNDAAERHFLSGLLGTLFAQLYPAHRERRLRELLQRLPYEICIDARACYDAHGHKIGLGSSAASAVGLTAALYYVQQRERRRRYGAPSTDNGGDAGDAMTVAGTGHFEGNSDVARRRIFRLALRAHRLQRGGGSGYDVAASAFGGVILFRGRAASAGSAVRAKLGTESYASATRRGGGRQHSGGGVLPPMALWAQEPVAGVYPTVKPHRRPTAACR